LEQSENNSVSKNDVFKNDQHGIWLNYSSHHNKISNNDVIDNIANGIFLTESCTGNNFTGNIIEDNDQTGLRINITCMYNLMHGNYFRRNGLHAIDNGGWNEWNLGNLGNFWDNYTGDDKNDDGIGDTPYIIDVSAGSKDWDPIYSDGDEPPGEDGNGGGGGGGGGGKTPPSEEIPTPTEIPFGNYYLLFTVISIVSLIIYKRREIK